MPVSEITTHPFYKTMPSNKTIKNNFDYDIALLKLAEPVDLTIYTPVCLPTTEANYTGKTGWVVGRNTRSNYLLNLTIILPNKPDTRFLLLPGPYFLYLHPLLHHFIDQYPV